MSHDKFEREQILVVDDDPTYCAVLSRAFEARNFDVHCANDGTAAIRMINTLAPEYALVDLRLPDMSGLKVVSA